MPTARVTANTTAQTLFTVSKHKKGKLTSLNVDNQAGSSATIRLQDIFTPDASAKEASPTEKTIERVQITVAAGSSVSLSEDSLKNAECLGTVKAIADITDTACVIVAVYTLD